MALHSLNKSFIKPGQFIRTESRKSVTDVAANDGLEIQCSEDDNHLLYLQVTRRTTITSSERRGLNFSKCQLAEGREEIKLLGGVVCCAGYIRWRELL